MGVSLSVIADKVADYASWTVIIGLLLVGFFYWTRNRTGARLLQFVGAALTVLTIVFFFWFFNN